MLKDFSLREAKGEVGSGDLTRMEEIFGNMDELIKFMKENIYNVGQEEAPLASHVSTPSKKRRTEESSMALGSTEKTRPPTQSSSSNLQEVVVDYFNM